MSVCLSSMVYSQYYSLVTKVCQTTHINSMCSRFLSCIINLRETLVHVYLTRQSQGELGHAEATNHTEYLLYS